jgi:hypothetical protein
VSGDPSGGEELTDLLAQKKALLEELRRALPAHSVRPHQLIEIEDLEDDITDLEAALAETPRPQE